MVIEHNLDVIKTADWIIDLGPEGGDKGGTIVACGTPEQVAECEKAIQDNFLNLCYKAIKSDQKSRFLLRFKVNLSTMRDVKRVFAVDTKKIRIS